VYGFVKKKVGKGKGGVVSFLLFFLGPQEEDQGREVGSSSQRGPKADDGRHYGTQADNGCWWSQRG